MAGVGAAVALVITLFVSMTAAPAPPRTADPSAFSRSALGYLALAKSLERSGQTVLVSRWNSGLRARPTVPVLALEPIKARAQLQDVLRDASDQGATVVLGLPKWTGQKDDRGWVTNVGLVRETAALEPLVDRLDPGGSLVRPEAITGCATTLGDVVPTLPHSPQLLATELAEPLVWCNEGVLVGAYPRADDPPLIVIADPDLWNTHGLGQGDNAAIVDALLRDHLSASGVIFDETIHGFEQAPSIWQELTSFPLSIFVVHLTGLLALSVLAAAVRFGPLRSVPPRLPPGKDGLITSTVRLLQQGPRRSHVLRRYFATTMRRAADALGFPASLTEEERLDALERHCARHGTAERPSRLAKAIAGLPESPPRRRALHLARRIRVLREEITHANG